MTSKPQPRIKVMFTLTGAGIEPTEITQLIGVDATKTWRLGESIQETKLLHKNDGWSLLLSDCEAWDFDAVMQESLEALTPLSCRILDACARFGLNGEFACVVVAGEIIPAFSLSAATIRRLAEMNVSLDIDLYLT